MSSSIVVSNLTKAYSIYEKPSHRFLDMVSGGRLGKKKFFYALKGFNLTIARGESVGILGKNGAGKSTLLQLLSGILSPTEGSIVVNGRVSALLELGAGFNPEFTGRENIILSAMIYGIDFKDRPEKLQSIIDFADIGDFIDQPVKFYSSGMYVRLAFAISSQMDPDILIVDEALSVGDLRFQTKCLRLIENLRSKGCTFIFVSHSPRTVELFCDRAIWLDAGAVKLDGDPKHVVRAYENYMVGGLEYGSNENKSLDAKSELRSDIADGYVILDHSFHKESNGGVEFIKARMKLNSEVIHHIDSKEFSFCIELIYQVKRVVNKPLWAVGIFNELNQPVIHFNSDNDYVTLDEGNKKFELDKQEKITFSCRIPQLRPGDYLVAIGLDDGVPGSSEVITHIYDAFKITVYNSGVSPQAGYIQINNCKISFQ